MEILINVAEFTNSPYDWDYYIIWCSGDVMVRNCFTIKELKFSLKRIADIDLLLMVRIQ